MQHEVGDSKNGAQRPGDGLETHTVPRRSQPNPQFEKSFANGVRDEGKPGAAPRDWTPDLCDEDTEKNQAAVEDQTRKEEVIKHVDGFHNAANNNHDAGNETAPA